MSKLVTDDGRTHIESPLMRESLVDAKTTLRRPIEVVAWADEEGARFGVGLFGSTATFGRLAHGVTDRRDRDGISIAQALRTLVPLWVHSALRMQE